MQGRILPPSLPRMGKAWAVVRERRAVAVNAPLTGAIAAFEWAGRRGPERRLDDRSVRFRYATAPIEFTLRSLMRGLLDRLDLANARQSKPREMCLFSIVLPGAHLPWGVTSLGTAWRELDDAHRELARRDASLTSAIAERGA